MSSRSESKQSQSSTTTDNRVQADGEAKVISSGGGDLHIVADEAFELGFAAVETTAKMADGVTRTLSKALKTTQENSRTESAQMGEQIIKLGIPALALAYAVSRGMK